MLVRRGITLFLAAVPAWVYNRDVLAHLPYEKTLTEFKQRHVTECILCLALVPLSCSFSSVGSKSVPVFHSERTRMQGHERGSHSIYNPLVLFVLLCGHSLALFNCR
jgi:hypothetical protein